MWNNVPRPAVVRLLCGYPRLAMTKQWWWGVLVHIHPGAPVTAHHSTQLSQSHIPPFSMENYCQVDTWGLNCSKITRHSVTPWNVGAISQYICGKGLTRLPAWTYHPHDGRSMLRLSLLTTAPLQSADRNWCFPLQGVGCRGQTYLAVEGICLKGVTASPSLDTLSVDTEFNGL